MQLTQNYSQHTGLDLHDKTLRSLDDGVVGAPRSFPGFRIPNDLDGDLAFLRVGIVRVLYQGLDLVICVPNAFVVDRHTVFLDAALEGLVA